MSDVEDPPLVDMSPQVLEQVLIPDILHTGRGVVISHLALQWQGEVVRMHIANRGRDRHDYVRVG